MKLIAKYLSIETEQDFWLGGFTNDQFEPTEYFMLQRAFEFDEQDIELGMNIYHFEISDQGCSSYGGIERFELRRDVAHIKFESQTAIKINIETSLEIHFKLEQHKWDELKIFLENIFMNTHVFEVKV